ncbi:MAG: hypothetical protein PF517_20755 [Salinivirgaceae bacterium]|jgi:hypothetical protein|nr:hypothetical protein [Salinivirgaceae bacterium]
MEQHENLLNNQENNYFQKEEKPQFLTVLCILTFIGSGFGLIAGTVFIFAYDWILEFVKNGPMAGEFNLTRIDLIIGLVISAGSLVGALLMINLKRIGFFIYAGVNAVAVFLPEYSTFTLIFNALWIGLYTANFKALK